MKASLRFLFVLFTTSAFVVCSANGNSFDLFQSISENNTVGFRCPPCGCLNDKLTLAENGTCTECNMHLVSVKTGFARNVDERLSPLLTSYALGLVYPKVIYPLFAVGILVSIFLLIASARGRSLNVFLIGIIIVIALYGFKNQLYGVDYRMTDTYKSLFIPLSFILLIGPLIYFYVKSLLLPSFKWKMTYLFHFIPAAIAFMSYGVLLLMTEEVKTHFMFSPFEVSFSHFEQTLAVISGLLYTLASKKIIERHTDAFAKLGIHITWAKRFLLGMTFMLGFWGLLIFLNFWVYDFGVATVTYNPLWVLLALILLWIGFEVVFNLKFFLINKQFGFNGNGTVQDHSLMEYRKDLEGLMDEKKLYIDPGLSLDGIASRLGINPRHVSLILNNAIGKNFYDFINEYRIEEVKQLLKDPKNRHLTIEAVSLMAGFKSKSSFNTAFKKYTGMTPKTYMSKFPLIEASSP